jgi:hypothetical protein
VNVQAGEDDHAWHLYSGGSIKEAKCRLDTDGKETAKIGCDPILFRPPEKVILGHQEERGVPQTTVMAQALVASDWEAQVSMVILEHQQQDWTQWESAFTSILGQTEFSALYGDFPPEFQMPPGSPTTDMIQWNFDEQGYPVPPAGFDLAAPEYDGQGAILAKWESLGGDTGVLGSPTEGIRPTADGLGLVGLFQGGAIYWHPDTGPEAREVHGGIYAKWAALGWETAVVSTYGWTIGFPITDELETVDRIGRVSHFQGASIYWHPETGAYFIGGAIRQLWWDLGAEQSQLGYPISDEESTGNGIERVNAFTGGWIYWDESQGPYVVYP